MLLSQPIGKEDLQLRVDLSPFAPLARPLFRDVYHGKIEHLQKAVVRGENALVFRDLPQLTVESFNGIGGVNQRPDLLRILEIGR